MARENSANEVGEREDRAGIPVGDRGGQLVLATQVERGLACGCVCPNCRAPLVARLGPMRRPHFAHMGTESPSCAETAIHLYAKQLVASGGPLTLPTWDGHRGAANPPTVRDVDGILRYGEPEIWPARTVAVREGRVEPPLHGLRPDVEVRDDDGMFFVEIRVWHAVDDEKATRVENLDIRMIEIDLSAFRAYLAESPDRLDQWIRHDAPRRWVWFPEAVQRLSASRHRLEARFRQRVPGSEQASCDFSRPPIDWVRFRRSFDAREVKPLTSAEQLMDSLIGSSIWLDGQGSAEIVRRLTRAGGVYEVRLGDGSLRIVYLKRDPNTWPGE